MIDYKLKLSYNDIAIIPALCSNIQHRAECIPYNEDGFLPLFTAPMSSVVDDKNFNIFEENKIHAIIPRTVDLEIRINFFLKEKWIALSLTEFENLFLSNDKTLNFNNGYVLIDIANGHMNKLFDLVKKAKEIYKTQLKIMIGNIANPLAYKKALECNADFVRLGIGGGKGCFVKNTKITMKDGSLKNIQDIKEGDIVKTLNGNKTVLSTKTIESSKKIIINEDIECTLNHKFLVVNKKDLEKINANNLMNYAFYLEAEKLNKEEHLLVKNV